MKSLKLSLLRSLLMAVAISLGLAGCGGSSDYDTDEPLTPVTPDPDPSALDKAKDALDMAKAMLDDLPADATLEERKAAEQAVLDAAMAYLTRSTRRG